MKTTHSTFIHSIADIILLEIILCYYSHFFSINKSEPNYAMKGLQNQSYLRNIRRRPFQEIASKTSSQNFIRTGKIDLKKTIIVYWGFKIKEGFLSIQSPPSKTLKAIELDKWKIRVVLRDADVNELTNEEINGKVLPTRRIITTFRTAIHTVEEITRLAARANHFH